VLPGLYHARVRIGATTASRLVLLGGLYFAQGISWGFLTIAIAVRLQLGPAELGGLTAVAYWPWALKVVLGPLVDTVSFGRWGRRRPLILGAEAVMMVSLLALAGLDPRLTPVAFLALVLVHNSFAALQDVTTDALAISILPEHERGRANGVMAAAKYGGVLAGGTEMGSLAEAAGWPVACLAAAALLLIPATLVLFTDEGPAPVRRGAREALRALGGEIKLSFARRVTVVAGLFALVSGVSEAFLYPVLLPLMQKGMALPDHQVRMALRLSAAAGAAGSLLGGWLADRISRREAILVSAGSLALAHLAFAALPASWPGLIEYVIGGGLASGMLYASAVAMFMDLANPRLAATHFQFFMGLLNVRNMWAAVAGGALGRTTTAPAMFVLAAALELLPLVLLVAIGALSSRRGDTGRL
jgi:PAT family beta-lactamase induction signal transducer AmpG